MKAELSQTFDSRSKVVSFRLSDSEYALAQEVCRTHGYRGMSVLARSAFLAFKPQRDVTVQNGNKPELLQTQLSSLLLELTQLISSLRDLRGDLLGD